MSREDLMGSFPFIVAIIVYMVTGEIKLEIIAPIVASGLVLATISIYIWDRFASKRKDL